LAALDDFFFFESFMSTGCGKPACRYSVGVAVGGREGVPE
jgi:hypothetical protein